LSPESFELETGGPRLAGRLYPPGGRETSAYPTVVICHGIPSGLVTPGDPGYPALAEQISRLGFFAAHFNFRGCGDSSGNFDILGWTEDLSVVIDQIWKLPEVDRTRLVLLGFSAGAAVSIYVAARDRRVAALAACGCPAGFGALAEAKNLEASLKYFRDTGIIRDKDFPSDLERWRGGFKQVSPLKDIAKIAPRPLLLVHGSKDDVVDPADAHQLFAEACEPKRLAIIGGAGHRLRLDGRAMAEVTAWLCAFAGNGLPCGPEIEKSGHRG
jgi:fermentation-respiration switch protein FrsA (DUF1100 family)